MRPLLSVIIPLYNCEEYIERCLRSLLNQDIQMEILVIDDGSSDNGPLIVKKLLSLYPCIRLYSQQNKGPSSARNMGLKLAKGSYIYMMDADDVLVGKSLSQILENIVRTDADILRFQIRIIPEQNINDKILAELDVMDTESRTVTEKSGIAYLESTKYLYDLTLWRHIIRRRLIRQCDLWFDESLFLSEDYIFLTQLLLKAEKVVISSLRPYVWIKRKSSLSNDINPRAFNSLTDLLLAYKEILNGESVSISSTVKRYVHYQMAYNINFIFSRLCKDLEFNQLKSVIKILKENRIYPFRTWRVLISGSPSSLRFKSKWILFNLEFLLFIYLKIKLLNHK